MRHWAGLKQVRKEVDSLNLNKLVSNKMVNSEPVSNLSNDVISSSFTKELNGLALLIT